MIFYTQTARKIGMKGPTDYRSASGNCGKGVTINYKTINGLSHTLTGDVKCLGITSQ